MKRIRTGAKAVALLAGSALVLAACATGDGEDEDTASPGEDSPPEETSAAGTFTYGYEQEIDSANPNTAETNASKNVIVMNQVVRGFWQYAPDGLPTPDEDFGTYEQVSEDPLTVEYTFADGAVWSDGEPIDCDDATLVWAANSGNFEAFSTAGTTGYEDQQQPDCADGDTTFTIVYDTPFADWQSMYGGAGTFVPAHIVEANGGVDDIVAAVTDGDEEALASAAEFYNTGFNFNPGEWDDTVALSAGPFTVSAWEAGQSITLVPNESWWGTPPASDEVVIRFIAQDAQAQALQNGEILAMDPQPSPDLLAQVEAIGDSVTIESTDQFTFEHYDFNFESEFGENKVLREAFAQCLPRETIVENLIRPLNPEAIVQNSRYYFSFQDDFAEVDAAVYDGQAEFDVDAARALLEENDLVGTTLRLGHNNNARRAQQANLILDTCGPDGAGFDVQDLGDETFFDADGGLATGNFDVALFAWSGSALVTGSSSTYTTDGGNNNGKYSNPEVDELTTQLNQETDPEAQKDLIIQIETILWEDLATIPTFTFPGVLATDANVSGVVYNPSQAGLTWNAQEWASE